MYRFHSCEVRTLTTPLTNRAGKYVCFKVANDKECVWFVQHWVRNEPSLLLAFTDTKEFEIYYNRLKNIFKDETKNKYPYCPDGAVYTNENYPF